MAFVFILLFNLAIISFCPVLNLIVVFIYMHNLIDISFFPLINQANKAYVKSDGNKGSILLNSDNEFELNSDNKPSSKLGNNIRVKLNKEIELILDDI